MTRQLDRGWESTIETNLVFALSLLLTAGFALARLAKALHLPSVTGYIVAGIALGPSGLDLMTGEVLENRLQVFTNIALMLVAFGIGERFDLQQLRTSARAVVRVSIGESGGTFLLVGAAVGVVAWLTGEGGDISGVSYAVAVGLVCASIAVATAPAATVAVIRELEASGPVSRLVLSNVVVNNALSVTLFGLAVAAAQVMLGTGGGSTLSQALKPFAVTVGSLVLGIAVGLACDFVVHRLHQRADVLVVALAAVFFVGGLAQFLGLSSLLAAVAAGFAVVNRDRRDVRAFRALNDFEPPIYGIFFTLAGAQLHFQELMAAGLLGLVFVLARGAGKYFGAWLGARAVPLEPERASSIGLGLLPQAGLAIGLAYLVRQDPTLEPIRTLVINLVVASVVINELVGPPLVRLMLLRAGEVGDMQLEEAGEESVPAARELAGIDVVPWTWPRLQPPSQTGGSVLIGVSHPNTAAGLTRIGVLLAHHYAAEPTAVHVATSEHQEDFWDSVADREAVTLFRMADEEARSLGYRLDTEVEFADEVALGLLHAAEESDAQAIVLGHPLASRAARFGQIVDNLARDALCPVVVVKFVGPLHTERILVPVS
ncbi:MAG: cation:proton antiporter, partial [Armatimonadota bacterium]